MNELVALLLHHGVLIVFAVTLASRIGAPLPAAPLVVVAGGLSIAGHFSAATIFAASVLANLAGDAVWFWSGRRHGLQVLGLLCRISLSPDSCVRQSEALIVRWGGVSLVAAKFVPKVSVVAAAMAGALAMPWRRFIVFALAAAALWTAVYLGAGMAFHGQIRYVLDAMTRSGEAALAALALAVAALVAWRWWRRRRFRREVALPRIGVDELRALIRDRRAPLIVDVRTPVGVQVDPRRIPGAILLPLEDIERAAPTLPRNREIVLYCACPNEASSARAALVLVRKGFAHVRPLAGGLEAWVAGGGPVVAADGSPAPATLDRSALQPDANLRTRP